jgi:RNA polymerase sigma factor (sigma-70 family)
VNRGTELQLRFATLLAQHAGIEWRVAYAWCRQAADRDDLVQEIHYQLWRAFSRNDSTRTFSTWMYRIALNVAISNDRRRKRSHEERLQDFPEPTGSMPPAAEDGRIVELFQIIDGLDPANRALLLLWLDDQSYAAIAEVLGLSENNVATRLSRLKQKLKTQFE